MSTDILASWKKNRFVIPLPDHNPRIILLTDTGYWVEHYDELRNWAEQRDCKVEGMAVEFSDTKTMTEFILRWA
jgi:hypothetical protein